MRGKGNSEGMKARGCTEAAREAETNGPARETASVQIDRREKEDDDGRQPLT